MDDHLISLVSLTGKVKIHRRTSENSSDTGAGQRENVSGDLVTSEDDQQSTSKVGQC